jgi:hypothetical protein
MSISGFFLVFLSLGGVVWIMTTHGSVFIRTFLRKVLMLHIALFCVLYGLSLILDRWVFDIGNSTLFLTSLASFMLAASIEE